MTLEQLAALCNAGFTKTDIANFIQPQPQMAQPQMVQPQMAQPQMAQPQMAQPQMVQPQMVQPQMAQPQMAQPQMAQPQMAQPQMAQPQMAQPQMAQPQIPQMAQTAQPTNNQNIDLQLLDIIKHIQNDNLANATSSKPENAVDIGLSILGNKVDNNGK